MHRVKTKIHPASGKCRLHRHVYGASLILLVLCMLLLIINIRELRLMQEQSGGSIVDPAVHEPVFPASVRGKAADCQTVGRQNKPVVWIYGQKLETGYLRHVVEVFERLGYVIGNQTSDWSVLWSHDYPFTVLDSHMKSLKPHQRVNHLPGSGLLTNKAYFATSNIDVIPKAFRLPSQQTDFLNYIKLNPTKQWVQKGITHRGIRITSGRDLITSIASGDLLVQEYVDNPLLIDGRRFDIGLYVTITSLNPLRVYVFQGEWLLRFCSKEYHPFDARDIDKYVIGDDYSPAWEIPSLAKFYNTLGSTRKEALFAYLRSVGKNPNSLNEKLEDAIRKVLYAKEAGMIAIGKGFNPRNFFEMVRFDFVVDGDMKVYLLEVNMSPNLSSGHFAQNQLLYEQVVYSTLSLVGLASAAVTVDRSKSMDGLADGPMAMRVSTRDLRVHLDVCASAGCDHEMRKLCQPCMTSDDEQSLISAYQEHVKRGKWHRVIPRPFQNQENAVLWNSTASENSTLSLANKLMSFWYSGKCIQDIAWCS